jgi:hypothetical protein
LIGGRKFWLRINAGYGSMLATDQCRRPLTIHR